jgi:threonine aldolase
VNFASDNTTGAADEILAAITAANKGRAMPYGNDDLTRRVEKKISEVFEAEAAVFLLATGTAANALALSVMAPPFGAVYCQAEAHVNVDECGAPEFYTSGAKLLPLEGVDGKITVAELEEALLRADPAVHSVQPAAISLTQATEAGTVYTVDEVRAITAVARKAGLGVHMDGARFANAVQSLGCAPADVTWRAGVDVLSFGATKNGALAAEAVVIFEPALAKDFAYRRKRGGHLFSKMRFVAAQWDAYLRDDRWLHWAGHANAMAVRLATGLIKVPGARFSFPVEANELFVSLPDKVIDGLKKDGFEFYVWPAADGATPIRLVTAFDTLSADVDALIEAAQNHS